MIKWSADAFIFPLSLAVRIKNRSRLASHGRTVLVSEAIYQLLSSYFSGHRNRHTSAPRTGFFRLSSVKGIDIFPVCGCGAGG